MPAAPQTDDSAADQEARQRKRRDDDGSNGFPRYQQLHTCGMTGSILSTARSIACPMAVPTLPAAPRATDDICETAPVERGWDGGGGGGGGGGGSGGGSGGDGICLCLGFLSTGGGGAGGGFLSSRVEGGGREGGDC